MKKILAVSCTAILILGLAACSKKEPTPIIVPTPDQMTITFPETPEGSIGDSLGGQPVTEGTPTEDSQKPVDKQELYKDVFLNKKYVFENSSFEIKAMTMNVTYIDNNQETMYKVESSDTAQNHYAATYYIKGNDVYFIAETQHNPIWYHISGGDSSAMDLEDSMVKELIESVQDTIESVLEGANSDNIKYVSSTEKGDIVGIVTTDTITTNDSVSTRVFEFTIDPVTYTLKEMSSVWKSETERDVEDTVRFLSNNELHIDLTAPLSNLSTAPMAKIHFTEYEIVNAILSDEQVEIEKPEPRPIDKQRFWDDVFTADDYVFDAEQASITIGGGAATIDVLFDANDNAMFSVTGATSNQDFTSTIYYFAETDEYIFHETSNKPSTKDNWSYCMGGNQENNKMYMEDRSGFARALDQITRVEYVTTIGGLDLLVARDSIELPYAGEAAIELNIFMNPETYRVEKLSYILQDVEWIVEFPQMQLLTPHLHEVEPYLSEAYRTPLDISEAQSTIDSSLVQLLNEIHY